MPVSRVFIELSRVFELITSSNFKSNYSRILIGFTYDQLEDRRIDDVVNIFVSLFIQQVDPMLPCLCSVIDHRRCQNVFITSVTHPAIALGATFVLFIPHFNFNCDQFLNRRTASWNLLCQMHFEKKQFVNGCPSLLQNMTTKC